MKATTTQQISLGRDEANHCKVLVDKIQSGDKEAALSFINIYNERKQSRIIKKYIPKPLHHSFRFILNSSAIAAKEAKRA